MPLALFLAAALAQDEACAPYGADRLMAEVDAAGAALEALQARRAATLLDEVHDQLPCLDSIVEPAVLARYARLEAVRSFYEQDPEQLDAWVQLALEIDGDPGLWPIDDAHPLRRHLLPDRDAVAAGPGTGGVAHPKKGGVFLDGAFLSTAEALTGRPHLVQVFDDNGRRSQASWQDGAAFAPHLLTAVPVDVLPPRWHDGTVDSEGSDLRSWSAARKDTAAAYAAYLKRDPTGVHAAEARRRLDDKEWERAAHIGTVQAARAYLEDWPSGRNRAAAEQVLEGEAYRAAIEDGSKGALQVFAGRYPQGAYAADVALRLDDLAWGAAQAADTPEAYRSYRVRHKLGTHLREARLAEEELVWNGAVAAGSADGFSAYLDDWPTGNHAEEARTRLAGARFWRMAVQVSAPDSTALAELARTMEQRLSAHARGIGFEVVVLPRTADDAQPRVDEGTGLLWVVLVADGDRTVARLRLLGAGLTAPLVTVSVRGTASQLSGWLLDELPSLAEWRRNPPQ